MAVRVADAPTVVSLFAGCGGSSLGYSMAGYKELLAVEWDAAACGTFRANFPDVPVYDGDISKLSGVAALKMAGITKGELDVLDGSPPCQGFSTAGKRVFDDGRNYLFLEYVRMLRALRPRAFVMENVSGLVKGKMRLMFVEMLAAMRRCGYEVSARLLNAKWFGVPQSRQRVIFVGVRRDLGIAPSHPPAQCRVIPLRDALLLDGRFVTEAGRHIGEEIPFDKPSPAILSLSIGDVFYSSRKMRVTGVSAPFRRGDWEAAARNEMSKNGRRDAGMESPTVTAIRPPVVRMSVRASGGGYMRGRGWDADAPLGASLPTRPPDLVIHRGLGFDEAIKETNHPSYTIRSGAPPARREAGSGEEVRPMTPRECALIQSFPWEFALPESDRNAYSQVGNAVPPLMMRAIALHVRKEILYNGLVTTP